MRRRERPIVFTLAGLLLSVIGLTQFYNVAEACGRIQTELVGWWKFDEGQGRDAIDSSGYGNHGRLQGKGIAFTTNALQGDFAVSLTDSTDQVFVSSAESLEPATGTFQVWINVSDPQDSDIIRKISDRCVRTGVEGLFGVYGIHLREDLSIRAYVLNDDPQAGEPWTYAQSKPGLITLGEWHQVVMRWDGRKLELFVDGKKRDSVPYDPVPDLGLSYHDEGYFGLGMGSVWNDLETHEFIGLMDDVRLHAGPLSNWQIWADYRLRGRDPAVHPKLYRRLIGIWKEWKQR